MSLEKQQKLSAIDLSKPDLKDENSKKQKSIQNFNGKMNIKRHEINMRS